MREPDVLKRLRVYNESRARMGEGADTLCVDAAEEIATLRADNDRLNGIHKGLSVGNGPGVPLKMAMDVHDRMEAAERERDTLRADVERRVKEVAHLKLSAEIAERERMRGRDDG